MTSKSSKSKVKSKIKKNNTLEGYVIKILEDINFHSPEIRLKTGTGKIRSQKTIADSIGVVKSSPTFLKSLKYAIEKKWLKKISTKKELAEYLHSNSRWRKEYSTPAYLLTPEGLDFAKSVSHIAHQPNLVEILKSIIKDEGTTENYEQIENLFKNYPNPFEQFKQLKIFDLPDNSLSEDSEIN
jgi:hypothetical protein